MKQISIKQMQILWDCVNWVEPTARIRAYLLSEFRMGIVQSDQLSNQNTNNRGLTVWKAFLQI